MKSKKTTSSQTVPKVTKAQRRAARVKGLRAVIAYKETQAALKKGKRKNKNKHKVRVAHLSRRNLQALVAKKKKKKTTVKRVNNAGRLSQQSYGRASQKLLSAEQRKHYAVVREQIAQEAVDASRRDALVLPSGKRVTTFMQAADLYHYLRTMLLSTSPRIRRETERKLKHIVKITESMSETIQSETVYHDGIIFDNSNHAQWFIFLSLALGDDFTVIYDNTQTCVLRAVSKKPSLRPITGIHYFYLQPRRSSIPVGTVRETIAQPYLAFRLNTVTHVMCKPVLKDFVIYRRHYEETEVRAIHGSIMAFNYHRANALRDKSFVTVNSMFDTSRLEEAIYFARSITAV